MNSRLIPLPGVRCLCIPAEEHFSLSPGSVACLIAACLEKNASGVLIESDQLPDSFFRLASLEAGEVLQKLRTYGIRLAAVVPDEERLNDRFLQMVHEERKGRYFRIFSRKADAEVWLSG